MDPISPRNLKLLQSYLDARCDIFLLAQRERLPVLDLLRWSQSPAVKAHLTALKELADHSAHLRTTQARLLALDKLEHIVKTTDDPAELRRAASTIYRGGCAMPQPRAPRKPDPDNPPPRYLSVAHRRKWGTDPSVHPAYIPPRPTPHDSFIRTPSVPEAGSPRPRQTRSRSPGHPVSLPHCRPVPTPPRSAPRAPP